MSRFFFFFLILGSSILSAQSNTIVQFNKSFFTIGEVAWYNLLLDETYPDSGAIISVSVFQSDGTLQHVDFLEKSPFQSSIPGYFKVPYDCSTDLYQFVFCVYEKGTKRPIPILEAFVPIYNDLNPPVAPNAKESVSPKMEETLKPDELLVSIQTNQTSYAPRSTANVSINVSDRAGNPIPSTVSISVTDLTSTRVKHPVFSTTKTGVPFLGAETLTQNIPIQGRFVTADKQPLPQKGNIGAHVIEQMKFMYFLTEPDGQFSFEVPPLYGPFTVNFRPFIQKGISAIVDFEVPRTKKGNPAPITSSINEYLTLSRQRKSIYQLFGASEFSFETITTPDAIMEIPKDISIWVDEYERFPDISTLEKELFLPLRVRKTKDGTQEVRVFNSDINEFYIQPPLFLFDGQMSRNENFFSNLNLENIEYIHLIYDFEILKKYFGPFGYNGVIIIESKTGDLEIPEEDQANLFPYTGLQIPATYPIQMDPERKIAISPALFWHPKLRIDESGNTTIPVPLSDDQTTFQIEVIARDDSGKLGKGRTTFQIKSTP